MAEDEEVAKHPETVGWKYIFLQEFVTLATFCLVPPRWIGILMIKNWTLVLDEDGHIVVVALVDRVTLARIPKFPSRSIVSMVMSVLNQSYYQGEGT